MVGLFHQPVLVLADLDVLETLPVRERFAGLAEIAKYALIDDPDFLRLPGGGTRRRSAEGHKATLAEAVRVSCASKARIVAIDETEQAERALLNLGHTFGHALERANELRVEPCCTAKASAPEWLWRCAIRSKLGRVPRTGCGAGRDGCSTRWVWRRESQDLGGGPYKSPTSCWRTWRTTRKRATES